MQTRVLKTITHIYTDIQYAYTDLKAFEILLTLCYSKFKKRKSILYPCNFCYLQSIIFICSCKTREITVKYTKRDHTKIDLFLIT